MSVTEAFFFPIQITQPQQQHAFLYPTAGSFLIAFLISGYSTGSVALGQIHITYGIIYLIQIFLVVVRSRHSSQPAQGRLSVTACRHLGHGDTCIESQFIGRMLAQDGAKRLVGLLPLALGGKQLTQQEIFTGFLLTAHLVLDDLAQVDDRLLMVFLLDIIIRQSIVPFLLRTPMYRIPMAIPYDLLRVIIPFQFRIAFGQPSPCPVTDSGLRGIEPVHIGKSGGSSLEVSFMKLRSPHQQPCLPKERVIFLAVKPLYVLGSLFAVPVPYGAFLDAMQLDGLLAFLYGSVKIGCTQLLASLVADRIKRYSLGVVVLIACFFLLRTFYVSQGSVIISIIAGIESMPPTRARRILLRRASRQHRHHETHKRQAS